MKRQNESSIVFGLPLQAWISRFVPLFVRPATHIAVGLGILLIDVWTPPSLKFPILFVLPVAIAAIFCNSRLAYALAVLLPIGRFFIASFLETHETIATSAVNAFIRIAVLTLLAFLVAQTVRQSREIKILRGRLAICMWCKRIRNEDGGWEKIETYIEEHSEADFSHGLCEECMKEHYGNLAEKKPVG